MRTSILHSPWHLVRLAVVAILAVFARVEACAGADNPVPEPGIARVDPPQAKIGHTITLTVTNWPANVTNRLLAPATWVLTLDGIPIPGSSPDNLIPVPTKVNGAVQFDFPFRRDTLSESAWRKLQAKTGWCGSALIGIATTNGAAVFSPGPVHIDFDLDFLAQAVTAVVVGVVELAGIIGLLFTRGGRRMLQAAGGRYSLGKCQMAWWLLIVFASYLYLGFLRRNFFGIIQEPELILLGISAATGLGAIAIDNQLQAQAAQRNTRALVNEPSRWFLLDVISDLDGPSLHRVQMTTWTLFFSIYFVLYCLAYSEMPNFDKTLLTLMGISGATYVGFKFPEEKPK